MPRAFLLNGAKKRTRHSSPEGFGPRKCGSPLFDGARSSEYSPREKLLKAEPVSLKTPECQGIPDNFKASERSAFQRVGRPGVSEPLHVATSPTSNTQDKMKYDRFLREDLRVSEESAPQFLPPFPRTPCHPAAGIPGLEHLHPVPEQMLAFQPFAHQLPRLNTPAALHPATPSDVAAIKMLQSYAAAAAGAGTFEIPKMYDFLRAAGAYQDGHFANFWLSQARLGMQQGSPALFGHPFSSRQGFNSTLFSDRTDSVEYKRHEVRHTPTSSKEKVRCSKDSRCSSSSSNCNDNPSADTNSPLLHSKSSNSRDGSPVWAEDNTDRAGKDPKSPCADNLVEADNAVTSTAEDTDNEEDDVDVRAEQQDDEREVNCDDEEDAETCDDELTNERSHIDNDNDEDEDEREMGEVPRGTWSKQPQQPPHFFNPHMPVPPSYPSSHFIHPRLFCESGNPMSPSLIPGLVGPPPAMPPGGPLLTIPSSGRRPRDPSKPPPVKKYKCDLCGKAFSRSNTLVTHRRIHTGEKPFKCEVCGRAFRQPGNLTRHRLTHTTVKPYVCPLCKKAFNRASNLHTHMRTHTNFKSYICPYCGKGFHQKIDMKVHCYTHTGRPADV